MLEEIDAGVEHDFVNLVEQNYSQGMFERNAKIMLGENWKEDGGEIIDSYAPELMDTFKKYLNDDNQTTA